MARYAAEPPERTPLGGVASYAVAMVGVLIVSLVLGPVALECLRTGEWTRGFMLAAAWAVRFPLVLANSVGFTASNREEMVGSKEAAIEKFQRASEERDRLMSDLQEAQKSSRWEQTAGCTSNRSKGASRDFCDRVDEMRNGIQAANAVLNAVRPAAADAMADTLSWVTGLASASDHWSADADLDGGCGRGCGKRGLHGRIRSGGFSRSAEEASQAPSAAPVARKGAACWLR
jgi:hypothetical protein